MAQAEDVASRGQDDQARDLHLRAAAVFRMARFPVVRSSLTRQAWEEGKAAYEKAGRLIDPPSVAVAVPFIHADTSAGDLDTPIQAYLRLPKGERPEAGWPLLLFVCGLDSYRTDNMLRTQRHLERDCATLIFEIPGTGDCPAAPNDPTSPEHLISSVLDWAAAAAAEHGFDMGKVVVRGISTGGYYAFRAAHTHADRLFAVTAEGGGAHHMFDPAWIAAQDRMQYPFALAEALAYKFGCRDDDYAAAVARYAAEARKFSLVDSGVLEAPGCKLLVLNGMEDSIFPIEDSLMVATAGARSDLIARGGRGHMGAPGGEEIVYRWIDEALHGEA